MEYHGHWPRSDEFNVIAGLFELRAHEYASGIGAQESSDWLVGLVDLFLEHMAESESGVLPMQTTSERVIMLFNFTVGMELKLLILPRMDHMTRVLSRLALYTPDVRNLTKPAFDQLLESACHEARAARTSHSPWTQ
jgi:hypothetical protein